MTKYKLTVIQKRRFLPDKHIYTQTFSDRDKAERIGNQFKLNHKEVVEFKIEAIHFNDSDYY